MKEFICLLFALPQCAVMVSQRIAMANRQLRDLWLITVPANLHAIHKRLLCWLTLMNVRQDINVIILVLQNAGMSYVRSDDYLD